MRIGRYTTAGDVSKLIYIYRQEEIDPELAAAASEKGVYIGNTAAHSLPYFVDFDSLLNPHVFIFGVTGSGKSYMMKSLALKLAVIAHTNVVIIDFTGEYEKFADFIAARKHGPADDDNQLSDVTEKPHYFCFKEIKSEAEKLKRADAALKSIVEQVRRLKINAQTRLFIFLDEAWKLLPKSKSLTTLLREGRKYGCGLVMASQAIEDIELSMLANFATIFVFRLQNRQSLEKLAKNYGLGPADELAIQNLGLGSCAAIQVRKDRRITTSIIERVHGFEIQEMLNIRRGDAMKIDVERKRLSEMLLKAGLGAGDAAAIVSAADENSGMELKDLILRAIAAGADRLALLRGLRKIGIGELEIADSFAEAIDEIAHSG
ncbi:MAG: type IV secretory system conjugative DNA transfer family protein [Candidatus Micrarchaeaceae archaeon]